MLAFHGEGLLTPPNPQAVGLQFFIGIKEMWDQNMNVTHNAILYSKGEKKLFDNFFYNFLKVQQ